MPLAHPSRSAKITKIYVSNTFNNYTNNKKLPS